MENLSSLSVGQWGAVSGLRGDPAMVRRLRDLGLIEGTRVCCAFRAPSGDPAAYWIRGALIAIRDQDAAGIALEGDAP